MEDQQIHAYKILAAHVLHQAIADLQLQLLKKPAVESGKRMVIWNQRNREISAFRDAANRFLRAPEQRDNRAVWLAWLGLDDDGFQKLLRAKTWQGRKNILVRD